MTGRAPITPLASAHDLRSGGAGVIRARWGHVVATDRERAGEIGFITLLRAAACALVVYSHLVDGATRDAYHIRWRPSEAVTAVVLVPLGITDGGGFLGVALFFLISGFIITHTARRENARAFVVKRAVRIYPPLLAAIGLTLALSRAGMADRTHIPWRDVLLGATLTDVFASIAHPVLAVSWTLSIEVVFYLHLALLLPVARARPAAAAAALMLWSVAATEVCDGWYRTTGWGPAHTAGLVLEYLPVFACGMVAWAWWQGHVGGRGALALGALAFLAIVHNLWRSQPAYLSGPDGHIGQIAYAAAVFVVCLLASDRLTVPAPVRWLATVSYAVYLVHFPLGFWLLDRLIPRIGFTAALVTTLAAVGMASSALWRCVERPSQRAARALLARDPALPLARRNRPVGRVEREGNMAGSVSQPSGRYRYGMPDAPGTVRSDRGGRLTVTRRVIGKGERDDKHHGARLALGGVHVLRVEQPADIGVHELPRPLLVGRRIRALVVDRDGDGDARPLPRLRRHFPMLHRDPRRLRVPLVDVLRRGMLRLQVRRPERCGDVEALRGDQLVETEHGGLRAGRLRDNSRRGRRRGRRGGRRRWHRRRGGGGERRCGGGLGCGVRR